MTIGLWREGKYIDVWSVVHMLSGFGAGLLAVLFSVSFLFSILVFSALAILWEIFEIKKKVLETGKNQIMDVVIGIAMFIIGYYVFANLVVSTSTQIFVLIFISIVYIVLNISGWHIGQKKK